MRRGDKVRFRANLGSMYEPDSTRFVGSVQPGDEGVYWGRHPKLKGWHLCKALDGLYVPCAQSDFEPG